VSADNGVAVSAEDGPDLLADFVSAGHGVAVSAEDGPTFLDLMRDGLVAAAALCVVTGPEEPACAAVVVGSAAFVVLEGCWWVAISQQPATMTYLRADFHEMQRIFNEMMHEVDKWQFVTNTTSATEFHTLSASSGLVVKLAEDFLHVTDKAITETIGRIRSPGSNLMAWSPALIVVPGKWGSDALRASIPMLLPAALLMTAMSAQGCQSGTEKDQEAHDLLVHISSNMATAIDQVQGLNACVVNPFHLSCTTEQVNDMITASKQDFKRVQVGMTDLGKLVNREESSAPASAATASPLELSAPAATNIDSLQALLLRENQRELEIQKELQGRLQYVDSLVVPATMVAAFAAFVWGLAKSFAWLKECVEQGRREPPTPGDGQESAEQGRSEQGRIEAAKVGWVLVAALGGIVFLLFAGYWMGHAPADPQATLDRLYNLDSYTRSTLAFAQTWAECARFPCSPDYVNDTVNALLNLTVQLLTDVVA